MSDPVPLEPHPDDPNEQTVEILVYRGDAAGGDLQSFHVMRAADMTLLDALLWIRDHIDPTLAFDYGCITNNTCKLCQAQVNGKVEYLCTRLVDGTRFELRPVKPARVAADLFQVRDGIW